MQVAWRTVIGTRQSALATCLIALGSCLLASCSEEGVAVPENKNEEPSNHQYYITLNVNNNPQSSTRGETNNDGSSTNGTLEGVENENIMTSATIYLCVNDEVKVTLPSDYVGELSSSNNSYQIRVAIDDINSLAELAGKKVQFLIVGNTDKFTYTLNKGGKPSETTFSLTSVGTTPIEDFGTDNKGKRLPLVNAKSYTVTIPQSSGVNAVDAVKAMFDRFTPTIAWWDVNEDWDSDSANKGAIVEMERAVGRFEFKDAARPGNDDNPLPTDPYVYKVPTVGVTDKLQIKLYSMQPFNVNSQSYLFRHTSAGTLEAANTTPILFNNERDNSDKDNYYNWIASPDWTTSGTFGKTATFLNPITVSSTNYSVTGTNGIIKIEDLEKRIKTETDGYYPWCYISENTIPSVDLMEDYQEVTVSGEKQMQPLVTQYATGVIFNFIVLGKDGKPLVYETPSSTESDIETASNYPEGVYNSTDHEGWIFIIDNNGKWIECEPVDISVIENGEAKTYKSFILNYIASIVHNNGTKKAEGKNFAPMYYGIVRNNTYQMTVRGVSGLPLPQDPRSMYLQLQVNVLPWNVRKNEFYF